MARGYSHATKLLCGEKLEELSQIRSLKIQHNKSLGTNGNDTGVLTTETM